MTRHSKILVFGLLLSFMGCTSLEEEASVSSQEDSYDVFSEYSPQLQYYMKKNLINYFITIAMGSEYGNDAQVSKKWKKEMYVFVKGEQSEPLRTELHAIIEELNIYFSDGFRIQEVNKEEESNFIVFFGSASAYSQLYPESKILTENNKGLFTIHYDPKYTIQKGHMYVDTQRAVMEEQLHILREEFTQALGLANDIKYYPNSIFYDLPSRLQSYSDLDKEVIKLLYHPGMISGLSMVSVQGVLENILGV